jgi:hypothetical protein
MLIFIQGRLHGLSCCAETKRQPRICLVSRDAYYPEGVRTISSGVRPSRVKGQELPLSDLISDVGYARMQEIIKLRVRPSKHCYQSFKIKPLSIATYIR